MRIRYSHVSIRTPIRAESSKRKRALQYRFRPHNVGLLSGRPTMVGPCNVATVNAHRGRWGSLLL